MPLLDGDSIVDENGRAAAEPTARRRITNGLLRLPNL